MHTTTCPNCKTVFRLTDTQLTMADGMVRCGVCHETFDATQTENSELTSLTDTALNETDEFSLADEPLREVIPESLRHQSSSASFLAGLVWSFLIILLALALVVEYGYFHRNQLQSQAILKPWLEKACALAHCKLSPLREANKIEIVSRNVYTHPTVKHALMIKITMRNNAKHAQPYPDIRVTFSDIRGDIVAERIFTPANYLHTKNPGQSLMKAGAESHVTLEVEDPGKDAVTYEFSFL